MSREAVSKLIADFVVALDKHADEETNAEAQEHIRKFSADIEAAGAQLDSDLEDAYEAEDEDEDEDEDDGDIPGTEGEPTTEAAPTTQTE